MKRVKFISNGYETVMNEKLVDNYMKKKKPVIKVLGDAKAVVKEPVKKGK